MNLGSVDKYFFIVGSLRCAWYVSCLVLWLISFDNFWKSILLRPTVFGPSLFPSYRLFSPGSQSSIKSSPTSFSLPQHRELVPSSTRTVDRWYVCTTALERGIKLVHETNWLDHPMLTFAVRSSWIGGISPRVTNVDSLLINHWWQSSQCMRWIDWIIRW